VAPAAEFRLGPRWPWLAWVIGGFGALLLGFAWVASVEAATRYGETAAGVLVIAMALAYARSPMWRSHVVVDERGLRVVGPRGTRLDLPWADVQRVVAAPSSKTCYLRADVADRSFIVPGPNMAVPYRIQDREALYDRIVAACKDRVEIVDELGVTPGEARTAPPGEGP
jgi:hypothetical protein